MGVKKIMLKSNRDSTQRYKVIIEKPTYAGDEMHSSYEKLKCNSVEV